MAELGNTFMDLLDIEKQKDPNGQPARIIEMLTQLNPMMADMYAVACNNGTNHEHSIRTGYPTVAWGALYQGITQSKSNYAQVTDTTGFVEGLSTVDTRVLKLAGGNAAAARLNEARGFLEVLAQEVQEKLIYGDSNSAPKEFMGLAPRFNDTSAANGNQIVDGGGSGSDNTSIWFVTWAQHAAHAIYPEGLMAGIDREDKGEQRVLDASGNPFYVKEELFTQHIGLAVKDWRYVSRVANIDVSDMLNGTVDLYGLMRKAYYRLQNRRPLPPGSGKLCIYCNTDVLEMLDALATNAGSSDNFVRLKTVEIEGEEVQTYRGIPIRETDALLNTEAQVT